MGEMHLVMWWVPSGHRPSLQEGLDRLERLRRDGPSDETFGWADLPEATRWRAGRCAGRSDAA